MKIQWPRDYQKCSDRQFGKKSGLLPIASRNQEKPGKHSGRDTEDHIYRRREYGSYINVTVFVIRWVQKVRKRTVNDQEILEALKKISSNAAGSLHERKKRVVC